VGWAAAEEEANVRGAARATPTAAAARALGARAMRRVVARAAEARAAAGCWAPEVCWAAGCREAPARAEKVAK